MAYGQDRDRSVTGHKPRNVAVAYLLWLPSLLGLGGLHRLYTGHKLVGLYLVTFVPVLYIIGLIVVSVGNFFNKLLAALILTHLIYYVFYSVSDFFRIRDLVKSFNNPSVRFIGSLELWQKFRENLAEKQKFARQKRVEKLLKASRQDVPPQVPTPALQPMSQSSIPDSRPGPQPVPRPQALSKRILILARDRGPQGFSINDAVVELDVSVEEIRPELENLMAQNLVECFNGPDGRILYKEFGYVS